ncbi:MAG: NUDIX hydrolase [Candidatus Sumerlaeaceae bacterium]
MCSPREDANHHALRRALACFQPHDARDEQIRDAMLALAEQLADPFDRHAYPAHFTASGLVISPCRRFVCLGFHRKLGAWLQFGGHGDEGEKDPFEVALRETHEESGLTELVPHPQPPVPLDLDIHLIPPHGDVPAHYHYDVRYLFIASANQVPLGRREEHREVRWFALSDLTALHLDESLRRSISRASLSTSARVKTG